HLPFSTKNKAGLIVGMTIFLASGFSIPFIGAWWQLYVLTAFEKSFALSFVSFVFGNLFNHQHAFDSHKVGKPFYKPGPPPS
ncbi:13677_t:CDS:2, partial [Racocetra persica]